MVNVSMDGKTIFDGASPKTQSIDAVKALLTWKGRAVAPMPSKIEFANEGEESRLVLVLSNKKDTYYVTTATKCSCPSQVYRGGTCRHMRKYFPQERAASVPESGSIRPDMRGFRPISTLPGEEKVSPLIDLHDTSDREAAYHSIREDKIMWPAEA